MKSKLDQKANILVSSACKLLAMHPDEDYVSATSVDLVVSIATLSTSQSGGGVWSKALQVVEGIIDKTHATLESDDLF